ncbi:MAG: uracil phosphoribosyltransferase [Microbacteriaceae bacterium]
MELHVADHPLIAHKLTILRNAATSSPVFRELTSELVSLLAYEATRNLRTTEVQVTTPLVTATGTALVDTKPLIVPILRAGLGMLDGMIRLMPSAEVGFLGMVRNEETLLPVTYAERLPEDVSGRQCILLDPMLATGGSLSAAIHYLLDRGATDVTAICLIAAPEGVEHVRETTEGLNVRVFVGALDEKLDERGYIVPGLGDAGDRLYGTIDH